MPLEIYLRSKGGGLGFHHALALGWDSVGRIDSELLCADELCVDSRADAQTSLCVAQNPIQSISVYLW